ncbi:PilX N-terminal domain-containing pilus assembly protein [Desulfosarcina ovata]|uniref:Type 4 fimbrial biogenesis protein PilX N-terminal domain-containing protein n=1 Tax=Desulfosarcina ovata subsp. ovata TaxID=2752305 RepID=A0A5K8A4P1_9BACT|nr:pilus assembly PilX N-terminal domain-containing protein [Desulfosarcina ovata]BBO87417.1 hypothetical protein DSCOOX_05970 [Desulfosarcina ovata subsp. ovata]
MHDSIKRMASDESGSVIIAALLILVTLTIMGIWAMNTTTVEYEIATNDQLHKIAFTNADSGVYVVPKLISRTINESTEQTSTELDSFGFSLFDDADGDSTNDDDTTDLFNEIMGYDSSDDDADISFSAGSYDDTVEVDIERTGQQNVAGGGVEFGSGAEGIGVGSTGGVRILYALDSVGSGPRNSQSNVAATYRKVIGVAGGL